MHEPEQQTILDRLLTVGKAVPRSEGTAKVTGKTTYTADRMYPGMVWGKAVRSELPHAKVLHIDTSKAKAYPGVLAVLTSEDLPDVLTGRQLKDTPTLARDRVRFIGEKIAVVGAESREIAEEAAALVDIEYEELAAVFDPLDAMREQAPVLHPRMASYVNLPQPSAEMRNVHSHVQWRIGDSETGFAESDFIFEQTFYTQRTHQGYLEPHASVVRIDEQGRIVVWSSNKVPFNTRKYLAQAIGVDEKKIIIELSPVGGDFGGKGALMDIPLCYSLAQATGRPVKMIMSYAEELIAANPRHPATIIIKSGVKSDGRIWAREARAIFNSGAYGGFKPNVIVNLPGARMGGGAYRIPHVKIDAYSVYTNCVPCGHVRGPGEAQMIFAVESHTDFLARKLGMDPFEFRMVNILKAGDRVGDAPLETSKGDELLAKLRSTLGLTTRKRKKTLTGKGIAIAVKEAHFGEANAEVGLDDQGKVYVLTTVPDTGTGSHTIFRQIVGEALELPAEDIRVVSGNTDSFPNDVAVGGSRVTYLSGQAVYAAALGLRQKIIELGAVHLKEPPDAIRISGGVVSATKQKKITLCDVVGLARPLGISLKAAGNFKSGPGLGGASFYAQGVEIEVEPETGKVRILRIVSAHDVATIINPVLHQGQIEGGMVQGLGYTLMEDLADEEGKIVPASLGDYKMPNIRDVPLHQTILLRDARGPAPYESKAIGEHSTSPMAAAIANGIYDATGVQIRKTPITAEMIYNALQERRSNPGD
jgi:CO/xanthine dehydrogenase Mo-binding subunit